MFNHKDVLPLIPGEIGGAFGDMPMAEKEQSYNKIKNYINENVKVDTPIDIFKRNGYIKLGKVIDSDAARRELFEYPIYNGHVKVYSDGRPIHNYLDNDLPGRIYSWDMKDLMKCKTITDLASNPLLISFASQYLGCAPTCYSLNCMYSIGRSNHGTTVRHRDQDDFKFVVLFVYLQDTDASNGAHVYEEGTHAIDGTPTVARGKSVVLNGSAGDGFMTDSWGVHLGSPMQPGNKRICLWIRYGLYDNWTSRVGDKNFDEPADLSLIDTNLDYNNYAFRFLINKDK